MADIAAFLLGLTVCLLMVVTLTKCDDKAEAWLQNIQVKCAEVCGEHPAIHYDEKANTCRCDNKIIIRRPK